MDNETFVRTILTLMGAAIGWLGTRLYDNLTTDKNRLQAIIDAKDEEIRTLRGERRDEA